MNKKDTNSNVFDLYRTVYTSEFSASANCDTTKHFGIFLQSEIEQTTAQSIPRLIKFNITPAENITNKSKIVKANIPIIPLSWDSNSKSELNDFVENGRNARTFKPRKNRILSATYKARLRQTTEDAITFILFSIAETYANSTNPKHKQLLANLSIIEETGFNLEEASACILNLRKPSSGEKNIYFAAYSNYKSIKEKYNRCINAINGYEQKYNPETVVAYSSI